MGEPGRADVDLGGTIFGRALLAVGRQRLALVSALGAVVWGVALGAVGLTGIAVLAPGLVVLGGAGLTIMEVSGRTMLQRSIRDEVLARVFGIQEGLAMAGLGLGAVMVSALAEGIGLVGAVVVISALLPIVAVGSWARLSAIDRRAMPPIQALRLLRGTALFSPLPPPQLEAVARRGTADRGPWDDAHPRGGCRRPLLHHLDGAGRGHGPGRSRPRARGSGRRVRRDRVAARCPAHGHGDRHHRVRPVRLIHRAPFLAAATGHPASLTAAGLEIRGTGRPSRGARLKRRSPRRPGRLTWSRRRSRTGRLSAVRGAVVGTGVDPGRPRGMSIEASQRRTLR